MRLSSRVLAGVGLCGVLLCAAPWALAQVMPSAKQPAAQPFLEGPKQVVKTPAKQFSARVLKVETDRRWPLVTLTLEILTPPRDITDAPLKKGQTIVARPFFAFLGADETQAAQLDPESPESWLNLGALSFLPGDRVRGEFLSQTPHGYSLAYVERSPEAPEKTP